MTGFGSAASDAGFGTPRTVRPHPSIRIRRCPGDDHPIRASRTSVDVHGRHVIVESPDLIKNCEGSLKDSSPIFASPYVSCSATASRLLPRASRRLSLGAQIVPISGPGPPTVDRA
jgi:hypothetical protein